MSLKLILICAGMLAFLLNHALEAMYGLSGYVLGSVFILSGFIISQKRQVYSLQILIVFFTMLASCLLHLLLGYYAAGFFESFLCYVGFPAIAYLIANKQKEQDAIIKFVALTGLISFSGSIFYYLNILLDFGFFSEVFSTEFTITYGSVQLKNTSIYGSSLIAGVLSLVQAACCAYLIKSNHSKLWWVLLILCLFTLFASLSRRAFIPLLIVLFFLIKDWSSSGKLTFYAVVFLFCSIATILFPDIITNLFSRFISIFDYGSTFEGGNKSRFDAIWFGISQALTNPFGTGFGSLSSIGKDTEDLISGTSIQGFLGVTESFYITIIGELGLIQCIFIFAIFIGKYHRLFGDLRSKFILLPLCLEATLGLGFLNPVISFFSLICVLPATRSSESDRWMSRV